MNTKICTDIDQSKKLIKLEVDINNVDMTYVSMKDYGENTYHLTVGKTDVDWAKDELGNLNWNDVYEKYIPAWSLSALLGLMPTDDKKDEYYVVAESHSDYHTVSYRNCWDGCIHSEYSEESLLDAAFEMVVWLKENNKI